MITSKHPTIIQTLTDYLGPPTMHASRRGPWWRCHWCNQHSLTADVWKERWKCIACGVRGDMLDFVSMYWRVDRSQASARLGLLIPDDEPLPGMGTPRRLRHKRKDNDHETAEETLPAA